MSENVGIVIVSHSADVARGTALMVEQMVGREVPLGWCGGSGAIGNPSTRTVANRTASTSGTAIRCHRTTPTRIVPAPEVLP